MPPKGNQKVKKEAGAAAAPPKPGTATPTSKPKAPKVPRGRLVQTLVKAPPAKAPTILQPIVPDHTYGSVPVDVTYKGESKQATLVKGDYEHTIDLKAFRPFELVKTIMMPSGEYEGLQAIIIRPSRPFPFLQLPDEAKSRIYACYFAPRGILNGEILLESKRKETKDVYAKSYADGSPHRVALLSVNREIHDAAVQIFYANTIRLESTTTLLDFLSQIPRQVQSRLTSISIDAYVKTTSRIAMHFLAESPNMQHLHITSGIFSECDPNKAAKAFFADAGKFLEAVAATKGSKDAAVKVITYGKGALIWKDDQKKARPWSDEQVEEFKAALKEKMK